MLSKLVSLFTTALLTSLALMGSAVGGPYRPGDVDAFPNGRQTYWDARALEQSPDAFSMLKRNVGEGTVTWLLVINSEAEADRLRYFGTQGAYTANFCDSDGVSLASVVLEPNTQDVRVGERVRYTLRLPSNEILGATRKVVLKVR